MSYPKDFKRPFEVEMFVGGELFVATYGSTMPFVPSQSDTIRGNSGDAYRVISREVQYHVQEGVRVTIHLERAQ